MDLNNYSVMIKEILSLRYYPSLETDRKKFVSNDFEPQESSNHLEYIENSILNTIKNAISEEKTSVALSGGVDSVLVIALLRKALPDVQIEAISIKFADSVDETQISSKIAEKFNANHHVISIDNFLQ